LIVEKLPQSTKEGEYRIARDEKRNATEGLDARYDVWGGNKEKRNKLSSGKMFSKDLWEGNASKNRSCAPWESDANVK